MYTLFTKKLITSETKPKQNTWPAANGRHSCTLYLRQPSDHLQGLWVCPSLGQQRSARRWCGCTSLRSTRKTVSSGHALLPARGLGNSCKTSLTPSQTSEMSGEDGAVAQYYPFPHKHALHQHRHRPRSGAWPSGRWTGTGHIRKGSCRGGPHALWPTPSCLTTLSLSVGTILELRSIPTH